mgnify:FL=1
MKIGFLFPGQGSQATGMGKDIYDKYEVAKDVYDQVKKVTGIDVADITFNQPAEILNQTKYTQISILTMSLAILKVLEQHGIKADASAGLSLGEYSALVYGNILSFEDGVSIVKNRGTYMQEMLPKGEWSMAAIMGLDEKAVEEACAKVTKGFVRPVNFNTVGQIVASGDKNGIEELQKIALESGAKKVRLLNTAGPFHTEKLEKASEALRNDLEKIKFKKASSKVFKNIDGTEYTESNDMPDILAKHIISPVKFTKVLKSMYDDGIDTFVEIGPGKTLSGFVKRMNFDKDVLILNINNVESLESTIDYLKKEEI